MTIEELKKAIKRSPDYINKKRAELKLHPLMQLFQHRGQIFADLDVINIHLVKSITPVNKSSAYIPYSQINNSTRYIQSYSISNSQQALRLYDTHKRQLIVNHTIFVDISKVENIPKLLGILSFDSLVILDIISYFHRQNLAITNRKTMENWYWSKYEFERYIGLMSFPIYLKLYQLLYIIVALLILSFATSLYTKIVTFLSPLTLYWISKCQISKAQLKINLSHSSCFQREKILENLG